MGYAHIMWVLEDGIRHVQQHPEDYEKYAREIGAAVLKLCLDPDMMQTPKGLCPVTHEPIFNHGNCINHANQFHSNDEQILVWAGACLRTLDQIPEEQIEGVKRLFEARYEERKKRGSR